MLLLLLLLLIALAAAHKPSLRPTSTFSPASQPYVVEADRYYKLAAANQAAAAKTKNARIKKKDLLRAQGDEQIAEDIMHYGSLVNNNGSYGAE
jgi:hypothetical protein